MTEAVENIAQTNIQIAAAMEQQSAVAEDINQNLQAIRDEAWHTAQGSAETNQACHAAERSSHNVQQLLQQFRV